MRLALRLRRGGLFDFWAPAEGRGSGAPEVCRFRGNTAGRCFVLEGPECQLSRGIRGSDCASLRMHSEVPNLYRQT